jgi:hypothetical protein
MNDAPQNCPRCTGRKKPGFPQDFTGDAVCRDQALWVEGRRERTVWVCTKRKGKDARRVDAF